MSRRIPAGGGWRGVSAWKRKGKKGPRLTGESRIDPTRLMLIRRMNKFPICFIISLLGNFKKNKGKDVVSKKFENHKWKRRTPILPVSERLLGISFVCSIVPMMSSSNNDILTDWESACERESFVLSIK